MSDLTSQFGMLTAAGRPCRAAVNQRAVSFSATPYVQSYPRQTCRLSQTLNQATYCFQTFLYTFPLLMQGYSTIILFYKTSKTYKAFAACPVTALVHDCVPRDNMIRSCNSVLHVLDQYFIFL